MSIHGLQLLQEKMKEMIFLQAAAKSARRKHREHLREPSDNTIGKGQGIFSEFVAAAENGAQNVQIRDTECLGYKSN